MAWTGRFHLWHSIVLVVRLFYDLTVSSFMLLRYTVMRKVDMKAGIIRVDLESDDDLYQTGVATMISLVPGTVVVEVVRHPQRLYLHYVDVADEDAHDRIQEMTTGVERRLLPCAIGSAGSPISRTRRRHSTVVPRRTGPRRKPIPREEAS